MCRKIPLFNFSSSFIRLFRISSRPPFSESKLYLKLNRIDETIQYANKARKSAEKQKDMYIKVALKGHRSELGTYVFTTKRNGKVK